MRPKNALKMLYRSPVRTVVTLILLVAVTFALFSQVMEYAIAEREMEKAVWQYDGVLTVEAAPLNEAAAEAETPAYMFSDPRVNIEHLSPYLQEQFRLLMYERLSGEQIKTLSKLPYISLVDTRYMTAGYSDIYTRVDDGREYYNYTKQCVVEATVEFKHAGRITVSDINVVGGVPMSNFDTFPSIYVVMEDTNTFAFYAEKGLPADEYLRYMRYGFPERATTMITSTAKYGWEIIDTLEIGKRYLFVLRYEDYTISYEDTPQYVLTDPFVNQYCEAVIPLEGVPESYLDTEEFADVRRYINNINARCHTFDVVYTESTGSIRYFADKTIDIAEGRGLTKEDTQNKSNVCVIHYDMATEHGLKVGDTLTLSLGDRLFEQYISQGAVAVSPLQEADDLTEVNLKIVGIFKDSRSDDLVMDDPAWSYSANTIFVPKHLLPVSAEELEKHEFTLAEVSFVVEDAWNIPAFVDECLPEIEGMGLTVFFADGGWSELMTGYGETERLALIKIFVLIAAVFVSTCFVVFLYVVGKRRDYAIMRVLGTSKKKSGEALLLPLLTITVLAVMAGSFTAVLYTQKNIASSDSIKFLADVITVDVSIPAGVIVGCALGEIALMLLLALGIIGIMSRSSPLALIQAQVQKQKKKSAEKNDKAIAKSVLESAAPVLPEEWISIEPVKHDGKSRSASFVFRFVLRHIKRTGAKAVLLILVTLLLLSVVGQLAIMDASYHELYASTAIVSNFAGSLNLNYVNQLIESGYVRDVYFEEVSEASVNGNYCVTYVTSDVSRCTANAVDVVWAEGYSADDLQKVQSVVVIEQSVMEAWGIELGEKVLLAKPYAVGKIKNSYLSEYINEHGMPSLDPGSEEYDKWRKEVLSLYEDEINAEIAKIAHEFTVIGYALTSEELYSGCVFTSGCLEIATGYGKLVILDVIEATVKDNWKIEEYRVFGEALAAANLTGEIAFLMDTSKLDNVYNNIKLMDTLFPIITAAVMVIGAFLCGLIIVQSSKDIAIMRVLGTSKRRVRAIMVLEYSSLCFVGIVLAVAVLVMRRASVELVVKMIIIFAAYFVVVIAASLIAAALASRKNVLELLQTKE